MIEGNLEHSTVKTMEISQHFICPSQSPPRFKNIQKLQKQTRCNSIPKKDLPGTQFFSLVSVLPLQIDKTKTND